MADVATGAFPIAEEVMQLARALANDMLRSTGGRILTDTANFTLPYLNSSIRRTNRRLALGGVPSLIKDNIIISNLTPTPSADPDTQVALSYAGYFDGVNQFATPSLPIDLLTPLRLWERQTGSLSDFTQMSQPNDGIGSQVPSSWFQKWEWRQNQIFMPGSTQAEDLRVRYAATIPSIQANANFSVTVIPIIDGQEALVYGILMQYGFARGSQQRQEAATQWETECDLLINRQSRKDNRRVFRPQGYGSGNQGIDDALIGTTK